MTVNLHIEDAILKCKRHENTSFNANFLRFTFVFKGRHKRKARMCHGYYMVASKASELTALMHIQIFVNPVLFLLLEFLK